MSSTVGGMNAWVMRLVVENDIASDRAQRLVRRAAHAQAIAQKDVKNAQEKYGHDLQAVQGWVNTAQSAVQAASAAKGVVDGVEASGQQMELGAAMNQDAQAVGGPGAAGPGADRHGALRDVELTEGWTVGDRFTDGQLDLLTGGERFDRQDLLAAGFSDREATELLMRQGSGTLGTGQAASFVQMNAAGPSARQTELLTRGDFTAAELRRSGFSDGEVADLMARKGDGRLTPEQAQAFLSERRGRSEARSELEKRVKALLMETLQDGFQDNQKLAERGEAEAEATFEVLARLAEQSQEQRSEHRAALDAIELEGLERQRQGLEPREEKPR